MGTLSCMRDGVGEPGHGELESSNQNNCVTTRNAMQWNRTKQRVRQPRLEVTMIRTRAIKTAVDKKHSALRGERNG